MKYEPGDIVKRIILPNVDDLRASEAYFVVISEQLEDDGGKWYYCLKDGETTGHFMLKDTLFQRHSKIA